MEREGLVFFKYHRGSWPPRSEGVGGSPGLVAAPHSLADNGIHANDSTVDAKRRPSGGCRARPRDLFVFLINVGEHKRATPYSARTLTLLFYTGGVRPVKLAARREERAIEVTHAELEFLKNDQRDLGFY